MKFSRLASLPKWVQAVVTGLAAMGSFILLIIVLTWAGAFGTVPGNSELETIHQQEASRIISADGVQLGTFHQQNRTIISLDNVSPDLIDALLAIEDIRFYSHGGIDFRAIGRVLFKTILLQQNTGGGSTLTQQLAKNLYPREHNSGIFLFTNKLREMIIARKIENLYSKDDILELYLNTVSFGEDTYGIEMASHRFFNKPPDELTLEESAALAGLLKATTSYNPHRNPERSVMRRNVVIRQMEKYNMITADKADKTIQKPLETDYNRSAFSDNSAPYFREHLRSEVNSLLDSLTTEEGKAFNLRKDGLTIYTTLDSRIQRAAVNAVKRQMKPLQAIFDRETDEEPIFGKEDPDVLQVWRESEQFENLKEDGLNEQEIEEVLHTPVETQLFTWDGYQKEKISPYDEIRYYLSFLNAGFFAIHPNTGHVLAWVGGIDFRHFQYDQIMARRQPGSAFKPILYAAAIESGRTPCDYQRNLLAKFAAYDDWTPKNNNEEYGGRYSLQAALAQSVNTVAVQLAAETGIGKIQETALSMGIHSPIPEGPSVALGTAEISLFELTTAYTSFLNEGKPATPHFVTRIYDADGKLIYDIDDTKPGGQSIELPVSGNLDVSLDFLNDEPEGGLSPETAATLTKMLEKTVNEGTGYPLRSHFNVQHALGGKTGTTQNYTDGWFVGFTPEIVFGTRVGGANNRVKFRKYPAYASQTALPIAGHFLNGLAEDSTLRVQPDEFYDSQVDTPFTMECSDHRRDKISDRVKDFFTGKSSDEARVIGESDEEEKGGNIFKRIGRKLGLTKDDG